MPHHAGIQQARLSGPAVAVKGSLRRASPALDRDHRTLSSDPHPLGFQKRLRHRLWRRLSFAAVLFLNICSTVQAEESASLVKDAEQYIAKRKSQSRQDELEKAVQGSRQDPTICVRLAQVYLELGDAAAAESEACALREQDGKEGDYLSILGDALLRQYKFAGVLDRVIGAPLLKARSGPRRGRYHLVLLCSIARIITLQACSSRFRKSPLEFGWRRDPISCSPSEGREGDSVRVARTHPHCRLVSEMGVIVNADAEAAPIA